MLEYVWIINHNESLDIIIKNIQKYIHTIQEKLMKLAQLHHVNQVRWAKIWDASLLAASFFSFSWRLGRSRTPSSYPWGMVGMVGMVGTGFTTFNMYGLGIGWGTQNGKLWKITIFHEKITGYHWLTMERSTMLLILGKSTISTGPFSTAMDWVSWPLFVPNGHEDWRSTKPLAHLYDWFMLSRKLLGLLSWTDNSARLMLCWFSSWSGVMSRPAGDQVYGMRQFQQISMKSPVDPNIKSHEIPTAQPSFQSVFLSELQKIPTPLAHVFGGIISCHPS